ncbi:MAG: ClbS/DfsB family four-helix bundle protein [Candidatus Bathyarchaeota archaeon]|nr:ClbS/DfsB family four-helix bundle protein [Candidatus Termiticorpusculum sp.]
MPRATTKVDLIKTANERFDKMWELVDSMTQQQQVATFNFDGEPLGKEAHWTRDKNIRDVLVHLYEWQQLLLYWTASNTKGEERPFLPAPYNWKTYGAMNIGFWEKHQNTPYNKSKEMIKYSHNKVISLIEKFTDTELFEKKHYKWTGTSSLGQYCISTTTSHYDWAINKIKKHTKTCKN